MTCSHCEKGCCFMVKISSNMDRDKRAFKSLSQSPSVKGEIEDDRPSSGDIDDATLAPGLDGVEGMDDTATKQEIREGESTTVLRLVYDEYDPSKP
jgi:hypothetical protein